MADSSGHERRRFLKTIWGSAAYLGAGLLGFPVGSCDSKRRQYGDLKLTDAELSSLPDLTAEEVDQFLADVREAQSEAFGRETVGNETMDSDSTPADLAPDDTTGADAQPKPRVPPGQTVFDVMPVLGGSSGTRQRENWGFYVKGQVSKELSFTWEEFQTLPQTEQLCDIHCVTGWTVLDAAFGGVQVRELLERAGVKPEGKYVVFDCEAGYTTNIPIAEALKENVLIATRLAGEALPAKYGGLARGLVPDRYYYKSGKWVLGIRVLDHDEPGFWETRGYSNSADPWKEERFS